MIGRAWYTVYVAAAHMLVVVRGRARARRAGVSAASSYSRIPTRERRTLASSAPDAARTRRSCVSQGELAHL